MKYILSMFLLLILSISGAATLAQVGDMPPEEIDRIARSVVMIGIVEGGQEVAVGSGTIVSPTGLIYTNRHVVEGSSDLYIYLLDDMNEQPVFTYRARPLAVFSEMDFAIIQIDRNANGGVVIPTQLDLPFLTPTPNEIARGERIYVFGYPVIGEGFMVLTDGLISSAQNGTIGEERMVTWYQTNAEIAPGNSGGLAVTAGGELVGIPTSVLSEDRTSARLGGILPFRAVLALAESGGATVTDGGSTSTTNTGSGQAMAEITEIDHNVQRDGLSGMVVHSNITINGYKDQSVIAGVFFYNTEGALIGPGAAASEDLIAPNGLLRARVDLTPGFDSTIYEDLEFFIPYAAFPDGLSGEVSFFAEADVYDGENWISPSNQMELVITYSDASAATTQNVDTGVTTEILSIDHNIEQNGQVGMLIHTNISVIGHKDQDLIAGVFFYDTNDSLVEASVNASEDLVAPNGLLRARFDLTPGFDNTIYDDAQFFVPYDAFPLGLSGDVSFFAEADVFDGDNWISPSNKMELILEYPGSDSSSTSTTTQQQTTIGGGITASCSDVTINNGVEIIVRQMRPGFTYTATAVGVDGFDPVLIVRDTTSPTDCLSNDDSEDAAKYQVNLPTSDAVAASNRSAQLFFSHSNAGMTDISLIVGDYSGNAGEFVLVLEGMAVTPEDGAGDPFTLDLNPSVIGANIPLSVYMLGAESQLDPVFHLLDGNLEVWADTDGLAINCDDSGTESCWGQSGDLSSAQIRRGSNGILNGDNLDAMLVLPVQSISPQPMTFLMNSYQSRGLYAIVFHMGLS